MRQHIQIVLVGLMCFILFNRWMGYATSQIPLPPIQVHHHAP